jgi:hypothetical protein
MSEHLESLEITRPWTWLDTLADTLDRVTRRALWDWQYLLNPLEKCLVFIVLFASLASTQMLVDVPGLDVPDVKDFTMLFPNTQPL